MRAVPNELWSRIFTFYFDAEDRDEDDLGHLKSRFLIAQVCSQWRNAILSDGRFWTSIDFYRDQPCSDCILDEFQFFLEQSSPFPFTLRFLHGIKIGPLPDSSSRISKISELLHPHIPRIKTLALSYHVLNESIIFPSDTNFKMLQKLTYNHCGVSQGYPQDGLSFLGSTRVEQLALINLNQSFLNGPQDGVFPYTHLTALKLTSHPSAPTIDPVSIFYVVLQCTRLVSCTLELGASEINWNSPQLPRSTVTFPFLTHLSICKFQKTPRISEFLHFIVSPRLEALSLQAAGNDYRQSMWDSVGMLRWKTQCGFSLRSVSVHALNFNLENFYAFCGSMVTLEDVSVKINSGASDILRRLQTPSSDGSFLWPNLKKLGLRTSRSIQGTKSEIISLLDGLVESRWHRRFGHADRLKRLEAIRFGPLFITDRPYIPWVQVDKHMDRYRREGLVFLIYHEKRW